MIQVARLLLFALSCIFLLHACTKPVTLGSDFLEDEKANLHFVDNFSLTFFTEATDSVLTHSESASQQLTTYMLGHIDEPIFGKYTAEIYAQPVITTVATVLKDAILDSVVLQLRYDTGVYYGSLTSPVTIEVFQMIENPPLETKVYSNQRFMTNPALLGSATFVPAPKDSVTVIGGGDTLRQAPHIRIPLDKFLLGSFTSQTDSTIYENIDTFLNFFNGIHIRMTGVSNTMLGLNLLSSVSGMTFYYTKGTATNQSFKLLFTSGAVKHVYMEHDYTGSVVGGALTPDPENDLWFVQGLSGPTSYMRVEGLDLLGNAVINNAELEFYVSFPAGDVPAFYPPIEYLITQEKTDTSLIQSVDVRNALDVTRGAFQNNTYHTLFGGNLTDTIPGPPVVYRYNMRVTNQVKEIYSGTEENIIYFNPILKGNIPNRSVLYGPNHPALAPRLRIYYTEL
jgi:hypothetical protein